jgi:spore coat protein CotH
MKLRTWAALPALSVGLLVLALKLGAQPPQGGPPPFGRGGPGGPGGFMGQQRKLVKQFDKNGDGWLNKDERQAAREFLKKDGAGRGGFGRGRGGFGPPGMFGRGGPDAPRPGPKVSPTDAQAYPSASLYEPTVLRTFFLDFENKDWEAELEDFHGTDVEVPATLTVDGKKYPNVGVHFRGMSSYFMVRAGHKRSLNLKLALADKKQRLHGYRTLNLLNSHDDPAFLSTVLYSHVGRQYIPVPKANFVKVVINGESWGVYVNTQQFNKDFLAENYKTTKGTRWKVRGSPGGGGGLDYLGDDVAAYRGRYEIKSGESDKAWKALVKLCKTLHETPADKLEAALAPMLDIDGLLWFLALDVALINDDGYWIRASDYSIYLDDKGKFHVIPHDMNEAFRPAGGPGFGPPGGFGMRMPRPGEVMPAPLQEMLRLTEAQKKQLAALQKDVDGKLAKLLSGEQNKQLKDMRERGPFGFGPPGGGPGGPGGRGGPGGFGPGGPGFGGRGGGVELDPLVGLDDARKPLRSKVLAVPGLRAKYLQNVRTIAAKSLDWNNLGPVVEQYRKLIEKEVEADTRKIDSFADFQRLTADTAGAAGPPRGRGQGMNLRAFADQRRAYLLNHAEVKKAAAGKPEGVK